LYFCLFGCKFEVWRKKTHLILFQVGFFFIIISFIFSHFLLFIWFLLFCNFFFFSNYFPPCTLQNCWGTLLVLSLIDVIGSLWPWMTLDDGTDGLTTGWMDDGKDG
jgi:hypothetical protein